MLYITTQNEFIRIYSPKSKGPDKINAKRINIENKFLHVAVIFVWPLFLDGFNIDKCIEYGGKTAYMSIYSPAKPPSNF